MKSAGVIVGDVIRVIGRASVMVGSVARKNWARFVEVRNAFGLVRGWSQNPAAFGLTSSILVPGIPSCRNDLEHQAQSSTPEFIPRPRGDYRGTALKIEVPDIYADSRIFLAWSWAA